MSDSSKIEWTDATWNPTVGCSIVSPGCTNCYAMKLAHGLERCFGSKKYGGLTKIVNGNAVWTGEVRLDEEALLQPLKWKRGRRIFVNSMSDLFHESLDDVAIDRVFAIMALCPQHTFQVLTKRADRMRKYCADNTGQCPDYLGERIWEWDLPEHRFGHLIHVNFPLSNVWLGVSCERQQEYDERKEHLRNTPAAIHFFSMEPLLGPIVADYLGDWVIAGGESGSNARPMHPQWARDLRDQCATAGVPFFFKQWGEWGPDDGPPDSGADRIMEGRARCAWWDQTKWHFEESGYHVDLDVSAGSGEWCYRLGKKEAGRLLDGKEHNEFPQSASAKAEAA